MTSPMWFSAKSNRTLQTTPQTAQSFIQSFEIALKLTTMAHEAGIAWRQPGHAIMPSSWLPKACPAAPSHLEHPERICSVLHCSGLSQSDSHFFQVFGQTDAIRESARDSANHSQESLVPRSCRPSQHLLLPPNRHSAARRRFGPGQ
jgi:hypothetical protein